MPSPSPPPFVLAPQFTAVLWFAAHLQSSCQEHVWDVGVSKVNISQWPPAEEGKERKPGAV